MQLRLSILVAVTMLGACGVSKEELADSAAARADARRDYATKAGMGDVSAYLAAKAAYTQASQSRGTGGTISVGSDSAMKELEARLEAMIGPIAIQGRNAPTRVNFDGAPSPGYESARNLDGLRVIHGDTVTIVVSTPELVTSWLRSGGDSSGVPLVGLATDRILTQVVSAPNAALWHYADIPTNPDTSRGVLFAALFLRAQEVSTEPPDEVVVGVRRENRIFLVFAKARASIAPSPTCRRVWDSLAVPAAGGIIDYEVYRECFASRAAQEVAFGKLVAQVRELVALLPER